MLDDSLSFAFINLHHLSIKDNLKTNLGQFTTTITTFVVILWPSSNYLSFAEDNIRLHFLNAYCVLGHYYFI